MCVPDPVCSLTTTVFIAFSLPQISKKISKNLIFFYVSKGYMSPDPLLLHNLIWHHVGNAFCMCTKCSSSYHSNVASFRLAYQSQFWGYHHSNTNAAVASHQAPHLIVKNSFASKTKGIGAELCIWQLNFIGLAHTDVYWEQDIASTGKDIVVCLHDY